jgi:hypothetical protein
MLRTIGLSLLTAMLIPGVSQQVARNTVLIAASSFSLPKLN